MQPTGAAAPADEGAPRLLASLGSDRRFAAMLGLGFSSGLPFLLVYVTQSAWLTDAGVPVHTIGLLSEMTLAYKLKFLWAPFLERYDAPLLGRALGRRRGWIVVAQLAVVVTLVGVAFGDPAHRLWWTIGASMALGVAGATQDITIDGWRITVVPESRQALLSSIAEIGWRLGTFAAGAGALFLSDRIGWRGAYLCMAALVLVGLASALAAPEPPPTQAPAPPLDPARLIWEPIKDLLTRLGPMAVPILVLVAGFRMPGYIAFAMATPLFKSLHYSNTDIATVTKVFAIWVAIAGTALAGVLVARIGMMPSLLIGTVAASASHLALAWLAARGDHGGHDFVAFACAVSIDGFAYAFASIVLITYMSTLVSRTYAASQYGLLTSLVALPGSLLAMVSGFITERVGFAALFVGTSLIGLPVALLCLWVWHKHARIARGALA